MVERATAAPFDLISIGMTRDLVFLTSSGIIRTPGFGEGGLAVTAGGSAVGWESTGALGDFQGLWAGGVVGAASGGSGGFDLFVSFSGEGVLEDLELTTSSLITLVDVGFAEFFFKGKWLWFGYGWDSN